MCAGLIHQGQRIQHMGLESQTRNLIFYFCRAFDRFAPPAPKGHL
jgi:hypothetical protein